MEFYQEFLLTAAISVLIVILIGKLAVNGSAADDPHHGDKEEVGLRADRAERAGVSGGGAGAGGPVEEKRGRSGEGEGEVSESKAEADGGFRGESFAVGSENAGGLGSSEILEERKEEPGFEEDIASVEKGEEKGSEAIEVGVEEPEEEGSTNEGVVPEKVVELPKEVAVEEERGGVDEKEGSLINEEEEEWEGIERSELEKLFGAATAYVGGADGGAALSKLSSDVQMRLYGLLKVATEGPCYEPQPMALKIGARAKWHAWQRLGNMNPEVAMEQYISLLSESMPSWMGEKLRGNAKQDEGNDPLEVAVPRTETSSDLEFAKHDQLASEFERRSENPSLVSGESVTAGPEHFDQGLTKSFLLSLLTPTTLIFVSLLQ